MPFDKNYKDELLNDDIREVIAHQPHWLIRNANTLLILVIALLLGIAWLTKIPAVSKGAYVQETAGNIEIIIAKKDAKKIRMQQPVTIRWQTDHVVEQKGIIAAIAEKNDDSLLLKIHSEKRVDSMPAHARVSIITGTRLLHELITGLKKD